MDITKEMIERAAQAIAEDRAYAWHTPAVRRMLRNLAKKALTAALTNKE